MRVLIAPCSFKGSLSASEAARAVDAGLRNAMPEADLRQRPLADGGEGTLPILLDIFGGEEHGSRVEDPLGRVRTARYGLLHRRDEVTAVIEMAQAAGLTVLSDRELDPLHASTYGVGQLMKAVLDRGAREIWVGLGGSATVDGGAGMLQALGVHLQDAHGAEIPKGGKALATLASIDFSELDVRLRGVRLVALCDVRSPLLGPHGARLYMPQKGATPTMCDTLEQGLQRMAEIAHRDAGVEPATIPGAGAAGGLGAALAMLGARLVSGSDFLMDKTGIDDQVEACDLVVGGEGRIDKGTLEGKALAALGKRARRHGKPLIAFCGSHSGDLADLREAGISAIFSIVPGPIPPEDASAHGDGLLREAAGNLGSLLHALRYAS